MTPSAAAKILRAHLDWRAAPVADDWPPYLWSEVRDALDTIDRATLEHRQMKFALEKLSDCCWSDDASDKVFVRSIAKEALK